MMYKKLTLTLLLLGSFSALQAEYMLKESFREKSKIDRLPMNKVADMKNIPQDPSYYADQIKPFSKSEQKQLDKKFNEKYFKPWDLSKLDIPKKDFGWEIRFVTKKPIYRANSKRVTNLLSDCPTNILNSLAKPNP